jgi:hypothetical protein
MRNCKKCIHAEWRRTKVGKLHPSGDGTCTYTYKMPELPACSSLVGGPYIYNSSFIINRRDELERHCVYYREVRP